MNRKKKILEEIAIPAFEESIANMAEDSRIFVDKSLEIAEFIFLIMEDRNMKQKDLAEKLGKSEAEVSKWLAGMHNFTLRSLAKIEAALQTSIIKVPTFHPNVKITKQYSNLAITSKRHSTENDQEFNYCTKLISMEKFKEHIQQAKNKNEKKEAV